MITVAVIAVIAVVAIVVAASGDREDGRETSATDDLPAPTEPPETSDTGEAAAPPTPTNEVDPEDDGEESNATEGEELFDDIVLLEQGFSVIPSLAGQSATVGFVIQNTGDEVRSGLSFEWALYDGSGSLVDSHLINATTLQPGETIGLGDTSLASIDQQPVELELVPQNEFPTPGGTEVSGTVSVSNAESTLDQSAGATEGFVTSTFEVESTYSVELAHPMVHAIYRNSAGEIVGGEFGGDLGLVQADGSAPGQIQSSGDLRALDVDLNQVEVYVDAAYSEVYAG
ncbi:MAG: hypothetical protein ACRD2C_14705 [Acidimicrobiales bacterium]